ncbi:MAG: hypothetical protein Q7T53_00470 [Deltaproteobacteria bacterium]|nr:hypothetical protein [Deltaproteobacteria bacterium]
MKPPIIVNDHGDISVFKTVADAENYLESPDVLAGQYVAYDSDGRLLKLNAPKQKKYGLLWFTIISIDKISISNGESQASHVEELKSILKDFLEYLGISKQWLEEASLNDLLAKCIDKAGYTK